ncbi:glycosyltransferase [Christiangramia sabulilitoris]|uniref:Glycosyltransferase n=1 Tax=Christiangramia sabulilitoris TaxID=2583991 RepID=A0A550HYV9_9FLAO|nr:glycosyltransferase [Christiangramia sabulilitoris]TRO63895.1 glycosyltransferase [Christiangramia sabulilitoris]
MRILQLIDTLHPGGAERVALNYANSLLKYGMQSHICATRDKGILIDEIQVEARFHFLGKKNTFDLLALKKFRNIIRENKIDVVHAHGTSWFFAVLCKILGVKFKLIWHDHYGQSEFLNRRNLQSLRFFSAYFDGIISVNKKLRDWAINKLKFKNVIFLNNFIKIREESDIRPVKLKGNSEIKLICVANLRAQKDHRTLLEAFQILTKDYNSISLHLFGKEYNDQYSEDIKNLIESLTSVYWYGEQKEIYSYLCQADIGILSSVSEGLPLALLEYGMARLGVVITDVGECRRVIGKYGILTNTRNPVELAKAVNIYIQNPYKLRDYSNNLQARIKHLYSEEYVIPEYLSFCRNLC